MSANKSINREFENAKEIAADAQEHFGQLKDDAVRIAHNAADIGRAGVDAVRAKVQGSSDVVRDAADRAVSKGNDLLSTVQQRIEENPVQAIAIAAGVGVVLGLLMRRR